MWSADRTRTKIRLSGGFSCRSRSVSLGGAERRIHRVVGDGVLEVDHHRPGAGRRLPAHGDGQIVLGGRDVQRRAQRVGQHLPFAVPVERFRRQVEQTIADVIGQLVEMPHSVLLAGLGPGHWGTLPSRGELAQRMFKGDGCASIGLAGQSGSRPAVEVRSPTTWTVLAMELTRFGQRSRPVDGERKIADGCEPLQGRQCLTDQGRARPEGGVGRPGLGCAVHHRYATSTWTPARWVWPKPTRSCPTSTSSSSTTPAHPRARSCTRATT